MIEWDTIIEFDYDDNWVVEYEPGEYFAMIWDKYGFLTHTSWSTFVNEVLCLLTKEEMNGLPPKPPYVKQYSPKRMHELMANFLKRHKKMYCCTN